MDLLSKRYASPSFILDGYIRSQRFCVFIQELFKAKHEEERWEYFLHKVHDKSFDDFCEELDKTERHQMMTEEQKETTVKRSLEILNNFSPEGA